MRKHKWAIIAGVCVVVLLTVAGVILIPRLFHTSTNAEGEDVELIPGHWWKTELTEQQLGTLSTLWGQNITAAQLLQTLWPDVLQQMPEEAGTVYGEQQVRWPTERYEDWKGQFICGGVGAPHDEGMRVYKYYLGSREYEQMTLLVSVERGFTEDGMYRVSLYTENPQADHP